MTELKDAVREFFEILDSQEESDSGRIFNPVFISSCRVLQTERLNKLLPKMRELANESNIAHTFAPRAGLEAATTSPTLKPGSHGRRELHD